MRGNFQAILKERGFEFSIYAILVIITLNSILILEYRNTIKENIEIKEDILQLSTSVGEINGNINRADMALRGYLLTLDEDMVLPYTQSIRYYPDNITNIQRVLDEYGYDITSFETGKKAIDDYLDLIGGMIDLARNGNTDEAIEILKTDPGYEAWEVYYPVLTDILSFANKLDEKANEEYSSMIRNTRISQIILLIIVVPFLITIARRLRKTQLNRKNLFNLLTKSHKQHLFDANLDDEEKELSVERQEEIIEDLVRDLKKASNFINKITDGDYSIKWEGLDESNWKQNSDNLSGELIKMRDQMIKVKKEDDIRLWTTEGLSKFAEIIRNHQSNISELSDKVISNLVKYLDAKQGAIFILNDNNGIEKTLELTGCYAYERKKHLNKKVNIGDGLVGQCYLEKEYIYLKNVPQNYASITSGLGETNPNSVILVPLKTEDKVIGVIEIASLKEFESYEIDFLNQLAESISSAIQNTKINQSTTDLLEKSQQQAEELRAQEEEMRQNMEELQATQESAARREKELSGVVEALELSFYVMEININGHINRMNDRFAKELNINFTKSSDLNFNDLMQYSNKKSSEVEDLWRRLREGNYVTEETKFNVNGKILHLSETYSPIYDQNGELIKILNIAINITQKKEQEVKVKELLEDLAKEKYLLDAMLENMPDTIYFKDRESRFIRVSRSMVKLFKVNNEDDLIGRSDFDFHDKEHAEQAYQDEQEIINTEKPVIDLVEKETFDDGSVSWVSTTKLPLRDEEGKVVGTFGISRNITKIKQMEEEYQKEIKNLKKRLKK